jgi:hypothetical protein
LKIHQSTSGSCWFLSQAKAYWKWRHYQNKFEAKSEIKRAVHKFPLLFYAGPVILITLILLGLLIAKTFLDGLAQAGYWDRVLSLVATSYLAISLVNWLVTILIDPHFLPRMDFSSGNTDVANISVVPKAQQFKRT